MKKRIIGATGFVSLIYVSMLSSITFLLLMISFLVIGLFELEKIYRKTSQKIHTILYSICYIFFVISLYILSVFNTPFVVYITILLMLTDTFAYIVGVKFGKHKLSKLSPKKTIEGSLGGLLLAPPATIVVMNFVAYVFHNVHLKFIAFDFKTLVNYNPFDSMFILILISIVLCICGQIGDLVESYFKRSANIKDSGTIIYGHGGLLDRIDSWIFSIIVITLIVLV